MIWSCGCPLKFAFVGSNISQSQSRYSYLMLQLVNRFSPLYKNCLTYGVFGPWLLISGNLPSLVVGSCYGRIGMGVLLACRIFIATLFESHIILTNTFFLLFIAQLSPVTSGRNNRFYWVADISQ